MMNSKWAKPQNLPFSNRGPRPKPKAITLGNKKIYTLEAASAMPVAERHRHPPGRAPPHAFLSATRFPAERHSSSPPHRCPPASPPRRRRPRLAVVIHTAGHRRPPSSPPRASRPSTLPPRLASLPACHLARLRRWRASSALHAPTPARFAIAAPFAAAVARTSRWRRAGGGCRLPLGEAAGEGSPYVLICP